MTDTYTPTASATPEQAEADRKADRAAAVRERLAQCTGSEQFYRHWLARHLIYTEGIDTMAQACGAMWLVDMIASYVPDLDRLRVSDDRYCFHIWSLELSTESNPLHRTAPGLEGEGVIGEPIAARVSATWDTGQQPAIVQEIEYTDFPLPEGISLYMSWDGTYWTLLLRSEY